MQGTGIQNVRQDLPHGVDVRAAAQAVQSSVVPQRLLRLPAVLALVGVSRATLYRWVAQGTFVAPCRLSERMIAWKASEIVQWIEARQRVR